MKEVYNFSQEDLNIHDVMVLDVFSTVYLWIGTKANDTEKKQSFAKVEKFVESLTDGRDVKNVQYVQIDPCGEPMGFTTHFPEWEEEVSEKWLELDPYEAAMAKIAAERQALHDAKYGKKEEVKHMDESTVFDLETLQKSIPEGVNPARKEQHLSAEDFQKCFGMDKEAFAALKDWKRKDLKKKVNLF